MSEVKKIQVDGVSYDLGGGSGLSDDAKNALLDCFAHVAWVDDEGQQYVDALQAALFDNAWSVTNALTNATTSNPSATVTKDGIYSATISASVGYTLEGATVSVTMNGADVTSSVYDDGDILIPVVTGDVVITVVAVALTVVSISAVYTQSHYVGKNDNLDSLKPDLVVTATYSDSSTGIVPSADYTLSGTLTSGTSTITVSFGGQTTTFTLTVWTLLWDYTKGDIPTVVSPSEWSASGTGQSAYTITFVEGKGLKFHGYGGGYTLTPTNYTVTQNGILEIVTNFANIPAAISANLNIRATLNTAADTLIGFLFKDGIKVNGSGSGYSFLPNTSVGENEDHTLRVERTGTAGKVYLDGTEVYSGALRSLSGTNNVLITFAGQNENNYGDIYLKAIRFMHLS